MGKMDRLFSIVSILCWIASSADQSLGFSRRPLAHPEPALCATRSKHFSYLGPRYLFSWMESGKPTADWMDARNYCRKRYKKVFLLLSISSFSS